jgi:hypothetical protein
LYTQADVDARKARKRRLLLFRRAAEVTQRKSVKEMWATMTLGAFCRAWLCNGGNSESAVEKFRDAVERRRKVLLRAHWH